MPSSTGVARRGAWADAAVSLPTTREPASSTCTCEGGRASKNCVAAAAPPSSAPRATCRPENRRAASRVSPTKSGYVSAPFSVGSALALHRKGIPRRAKRRWRRRRGSAVPASPPGPPSSCHRARLSPLPDPAARTRPQSLALLDLDLELELEGDESLPAPVLESVRVPAQLATPLGPSSIQLFPLPLPAARVDALPRSGEDSTKGCHASEGCTPALSSSFSSPSPSLPCPSTSPSEPSLVLSVPHATRHPCGTQAAAMRLPAGATHHCASPPHRPLPGAGAAPAAANKRRRRDARCSVARRASDAGACSFSSSSSRSDRAWVDGHERKPVRFPRGETGASLGGRVRGWP